MTTANNQSTRTLEPGSPIGRLTPGWCTLLVVVLIALTLWVSGEFDPLVAQAESIAACASGTEFDEVFQLCYPPCKIGYDGFGPVCWQRCPDGFRTEGEGICVSDVEEFIRDSYTRGAGTPLGCGSGEEQDGALCYPLCRAGYDGVGPVCWQECPAGYTDTGALCEPESFAKHTYSTDGLSCRSGYTWVVFVCWQDCPAGYTDGGVFCRRDGSTFAKDSYGRGAGIPLHTCGAGQEADGGLCYPTCRDGYKGIAFVCWERCPERYDDVGVACVPQVRPKESYGRGAGKLPQACEVESFTKPIPPTASTPLPFTMIIASDPQLPWWDNKTLPATPNPGESDAAFTERRGIETNQNQVMAINNVQTLGTWPQVSQLTQGGGAVGQPSAVIMNGDLTSFGHRYQWGMYNKFFDPAYQEEGYEVLRWPIFTGLGNHDYANNVYNEEKQEEASCTGLTDDDKFCAKQSIKYIKAMMACQTVSNFDANQITSYDNASLAYSWEIGSYHFVQLHNYPTYDGYGGLVDIKPSIPWLKQDLAAATAAGKKIVLNMHDYGDDMKGNDPAFQEAIQGQNVVALFAAHFHWAFGYSNVIPNSNIPFFYAGSSEYNKFLLAEFGDKYINVGVIDSTIGVPQFLTPTLPAKLNTYPITPIVFRDEVTTTQDSAIVINVLGNDASPNGTALTISNLGDVLGGTSRLLGGKLVYTPHPGFSGVENFTYTVSDGLNQATSQVKINVTANESNSLTNQPPMVVDNSFALAQLNSTGGVALNVLVDDSDANGDALTLLAVETPSHGVARIENNQIIYTPQADYTGVDEFTYTVSDGYFIRIANVTVQVTGNSAQQFVYLPVVQR
ncbi:MAG: Ig-like domain-containing protein [Caldilineaceae bacterium]